MSWLAGLFGGTTVRDIVKQDEWSLAEGTHEGHPLILRFRAGFRSRPDTSAWPKLIRVTWVLGDGGTGVAAATVFEDRLISAVEHDFTAVLTAVITMGDLRTWVFYGADLQAFVDRLSALPQEQDHVETISEPDPGWAFFHENVLAGAR